MFPFSNSFPKTFLFSSTTPNVLSQSLKSMMAPPRKIRKFWFPNQSHVNFDFVNHFLVHELFGSLECTISWEDHGRPSCHLHGGVGCLPLKHFLVHNLVIYNMGELPSWLWKDCLVHNLVLQEGVSSLTLKNFLVHNLGHFQWSLAHPSADCTFQVLRVIPV